MFIIDTIIKEDGTELNDVIGGAGTYAAVGAAMFSGRLEAGFIVDYGSDTTQDMLDTIDSYNFNLVARRDDARLCTRGLNTYEGHHRSFKYITEKIRIVPADLPLRLLKSKSFHLICSPQRCIDIIVELDALREDAGINYPYSTIWEPVPDACKPEHRAKFEEAMKLVTVTSPNQEEAEGILGRKAAVETMARELAHYCNTIIIRCSDRGCFLKGKEETWFPAYFDDSSKIVDATGAGNTFCGALAMSLAKQVSEADAVVHACIAASLAIEQIGLPCFKDGLWNGVDIQKRVQDYRARLSARQ